MTANSNLGKDAKDLIPYCADQGMDNLVGTPSRGLSVQVVSFTTDAGPDDFVFADNTDIFGNTCQNMADDGYEVMVMNQTSSARPVVVSAKTVLQFTVTGNNSGDVLTLIIAGRVKGQLA